MQALTLSNSFFLFGTRGVGKTTLINTVLPEHETVRFNLLDFELESRLLRSPSEFREMLKALPEPVKWVFIDEIQRIPKLLDEVHTHIETHKSRYFALTGSSARKLKRGQANLLAGRAFAYYLFPFSWFELGNRFDLDQALAFGTLPKLYELATDDERKMFLRTYCQTYLQEEILQEGLVRNLAAFRQFLPIAATQNGQVLAWQNMASDVGVDAKTIRSYFEILEDTLVGFLLPAYQRSIRKRQKTHPKFYFFDCGVKRALAGELNIPMLPQSSDYGRTFEHWLITELYRYNHYQQLDFRFSYLSTHDVEIDLVIERPGQSTVLLEIKSADHVQTRHLSAVAAMAADVPNSRAICVSRDPMRRQVGNVLVCSYAELLDELRA
jgi:uncharacterized protein